MKEPQIVTLIIRLDDQEEYEFKFPMKKINMIYELQRERLMRFLIIQKIIQQSDEQQIILQFYDHSTKKFISEYKLQTSNQNFEFTEDFIKDQQEYKLIVMLFYDINFAQLREINQTIEVFEKEKIASKHTQDILQNEFNDQKEQFESMKQELADIKSKISELQIQKQKEQLDLVILYSNPIIRVKNEIQPALFVDYKHEINTIINAISDSKMRYQIFKATSENLEIALSYDPIIVHLVTHGDFDEQRESFYFDFQDDGLLNKLYTQEFQEILSKTESTRTKVICISSIVGKNFVEFIPKQFSSVINMKFYNTPDPQGSQFWETFYKNLSNQTSFQGSFEKAKEKLILEFQNVEKKKTCCCLHMHIEGCVRDPSKKGYELNHSKHLNCAVQTFQHDIKNCLEFQKKPRNQQQCGIICIGLLKHKFNQQRCKNDGDGKCSKFSELLNEVAQACGIPEDENNNFEFDVSLGNENQQDFCWACCCEINLRLSKKDQETVDYEEINSHHYDHSIQQKILVIQGDNDFIKLYVDGQNTQENNFFQYPDKQIILIHNRNNEQIEFQKEVIQTIEQYFEEYLNVMNKDIKLCQKELNFQNCDLENWKQYVADQLEIQFSEQNFFNDLEAFFQKLKDSEQELHHIFILQHIDKIYESNLFKEFYRHFKELISSNFILILTVNNIIKDKLKELIAHAEVQLIDLDLLSALKDKSQQKSSEDEQN